MHGDFHSRWVVMRGWQLYWYRNAGDSEQKGILTLPSQDITTKHTHLIAGRNSKKIGFTLPKEENKDGNVASRAMSFEGDFNTKIFRLFVSFMIKYKLYAEEMQRQGKFIDPHVERFMKIDKDAYKTDYRQSILLKSVDIKHQNIVGTVFKCIVPLEISTKYHQTIQYIQIEDCQINDTSLKLLIDCLGEGGQFSLFYLNLTKNLITEKSMRFIGTYLEDLQRSGHLQHLILNQNGLIGNNGLSDLTLSLSDRMSQLNNIGTRAQSGMNISIDVLMMPLLSLGVAEIGVNDQGFDTFAKSILQAKARMASFSYGNAPQQYDTYQGGMALDFRHNKLSYKSILTLAKLLEDLDGFSAIEIGHQNSSLSKKVKEQKKSSDKSRQQSQKQLQQQQNLYFVKLARQLAVNKTLTKIGLDGIDLNILQIIELMRAFQSNHSLQEIRMTVEMDPRLDRDSKIDKAISRY